MKLLLIEDDAKAASALAKGLREEGFVMDIANDGDAGLAYALRGGCDLVILDVALPGQDGWGVLQSMRSRECDTPVVMLTARDGLADKLKGLALGADDYVVKPYAFAELVARIRAVLRRKGPISEGAITLGDLVYDPLRRVAKRGEKPMSLPSANVSCLNCCCDIRRRYCRAPTSRNAFGRCRAIAMPASWTISSGGYA